MSALLHEVGTPCPRRSRGSGTSDESIGSDPFDSIWDETLGDHDDTRNIDFTTEIKAPIMTGTKPKRRSKTTTPFAIHSDCEKPQAPTVAKRDIKPTLANANRKSSLFAQPAQRFRPRVSFAPSPLKHSQYRDDIEPKKRTGPNVQRNNDLLKQIGAGSDEGSTKDALKKDIRRDTVYIPPEDTTVASVFMGIFSPLKNSNLENITSENTQVGSLECQIARKQQAKRLNASSGRPLQPRSKVTQESCNKVDIPGKNGGKENVPPGALADAKFTGTLKKPLNDKFDTSKPLANKSPRANEAKKPLAAKTANQPAKRVNNQNTLKASVSKTINGKWSLNTRPTEPAMEGSIQSRPLNASRSGTVTSQRSMKHLNQDFPLVSAKITNPAMYDDDWLSHQEVILTQLINSLLGSTSSIVDDPAILRQRLLALYQNAYFTNLYKRLQASLMYGALSIPKDVLLRNSRLRHDLGMKRKFIDIWVQTYEPSALRAALETITGRVIYIPKSSTHLLNSANGASEKPLARRLAKLLDAFLIQNQDMDRTSSEYANDDDALAGAYRRTVLRSLMMVILLDKARVCPRNSLSGCLFLTSSPYKSSFAVLKALTRFLLPSCGDVGKALAQLDCQMVYEQHPLEEYEYEMSNLAVDMRDGVRLTGVVELLLYSSSRPGHSKTPSANSSSSSDNEWPLSRNLKFPCLSRTVKMFNVKTALEALVSTNEGKALINNVRAADIVDGHREKTIALLWGLVSTWGLSGLVDMDDLKKEVEQLRQRVWRELEIEVDGQPQTDEPAEMLRQWASLVAQLGGFHPEDLTETLANGQVYECILDEYQEYTIAGRGFISTSQTTLEDRLRALGCSTQFINIVSPNSRTPILNAHSTTGALAFLCSRLLPVTRRARAALVIQNAWRRVLGSRDAHKRIIARDIARDIARQCAAVVQTRDRILWAKSVIVHWWRVGRATRRANAAASMKMKKTRPVSRTARKSTNSRIPMRRLR